MRLQFFALCLFLKLIIIDGSLAQECSLPPCDCLHEQATEELILLENAVRFAHAWEPVLASLDEARGEVKTGSVRQSTIALDRFLDAQRSVLIMLRSVIFRYDAIDGLIPGIPSSCKEDNGLPGPSATMDDIPTFFDRLVDEVSEDITVLDQEALLDALNRAELRWNVTRRNLELADSLSMARKAFDELKSVDYDASIATKFVEFIEGLQITKRSNDLFRYWLLEQRTAFDRIFEIFRTPMPISSVAASPVPSPSPHMEEEPLQSLAPSQIPSEIEVAGAETSTALPTGQISPIEFSPSPEEASARSPLKNTTATISTTSLSSSSSPMPSVSLSLTPSPSPSPSASPSPSVTPSPSPSMSATPSPSPSMSTTSSPSPSMSITPTPSPSPISCLIDDIDMRLCTKCGPCHCTHVEIVAQFEKLSVYFDEWFYHSQLDSLANEVIAKLQRIPEFSARPSYVKEVNKLMRRVYEVQESLVSGAESSVYTLQNVMDSSSAIADRDCGLTAASRFLINFDGSIRQRMGRPGHPMQDEQIRFKNYMQLLEFKGEVERNIDFMKRTYSVTKDATFATTMNSYSRAFTELLKEWNVREYEDDGVEQVLRDLINSQETQTVIFSLGQFVSRIFAAATKVHSEYERTVQMMLVSEEDCGSGAWRESLANCFECTNLCASIHQTSANCKSRREYCEEECCKTCTNARGLESSSHGQFSIQEDLCFGSMYDPFQRDLRTKYVEVVEACDKTCKSTPTRTACVNRNEQLYNTADEGIKQAIENTCSCRPMFRLMHPPLVQTDVEILTDQGNKVPVQLAQFEPLCGSGLFYEYSDTDDGFIYFKRFTQTACYQRIISEACQAACNTTCKAGGLELHWGSSKPVSGTNGQLCHDVCREASSVAVEDLARSMWNAGVKKWIQNFKWGIEASKFYPVPSPALEEEPRTCADGTDCVIDMTVSSMVEDSDGKVFEAARVESA